MDTPPLNINTADTALSTTIEATNFDPSTVESADEPRTWKEAKSSPNSVKWQAGYVKN